jgi:hypothetical protein
MRKATLGLVATGVFTLAGIALGKLSRVPLDDGPHSVPADGETAGDDQQDVLSIGDLEIGQPVFVKFTNRSLEGVFDGYLNSDQRHFRIRLADGNGLILDADDVGRLRLGGPAERQDPSS